VEQLIIQLKAALDAIIKGVASLRADSSKVTEVSKKQDEVAKIQGEKQIDLDKREADVRKIEDVAKLKEDALALKTENEETGKALIKEKVDIKQYVKDEMAKIKEVRNGIMVENKKIASQWDLIGKEWAGIKKDKEAYKENMLKELKAKLGIK